MFNWLSNKIERSAIASTRKVLDQMIESLRGMPYSERALLLYLAQVIRVGLIKEGFISNLAFEGMPGPEFLNSCQVVRKVHATYVKSKSPYGGGAALLSLSLTAISHPELRYLGQCMWSFFEVVTFADFQQSEIANRMFHPLNEFVISYEEFCYIPKPLRPVY